MSRLVPKDVSKLPSSSLRKLRAGPLFTSEDEGRYYRYYCEDLAAQITGPFKTSLWKRLIPQVGETQESIKHAIIALGALSKSRSYSDTSWDVHREYALIQYGKALKGMQIAMQNQTRDYRNALISCILVFCFESLEGHQASASIHASGAVSLLFQWSVDRGGHKGRNHPALCAQQFLIEEDLHSAFCGLDLQALLFLDNRPAHLHRRLADKMTAAVEEMPGEFVDLKDCRTFLQVIMRRNFHFIAAARSEIQDVEPNVDHADQDLAAFRPGNNVWIKSTSTLHSPKTIPLALRKQRDQYIADVHQWRKASAHLFQRTSVPEHDIQDFIGTALLKIHAAMNTIILVRTFFPSETEYDAYLPEFRLIVKLSTLIHPHIISRASSTFSFDVGIIAALSQVGIYCRDSKVRHQAVDLLLKSPGYQEGIWDPMVMGKISEAIMQLEEEWMDENGYIPGNRRATLLKGDCMLKERRVVQVFAQRVGTDREDDVVEKTIELRW